ncbi:hypothetical protein C815_00065 [Firmicutes bacterium M10-2]|nr:hypothetical protein C815_00065 [Firmicutes bacterium M10-2]
MKLNADTTEFLSVRIAGMRYLLESLDLNIR